MAGRPCRRWRPTAPAAFTSAGHFKRVGTIYRRNLAHILASGRVDPYFRPNPDGDVRALAVSGQTVYAGGDFSSIGGQPRNGIAAVEATTGLATGWSPDHNGGVSDLAVSGRTVYVAGRFTSIGGQARTGIAALDATTGRATGWNPDPNGPVGTLAVSGRTVYAGGDFTSIGGQTRHRIAALGATTGQATSWNPDPNGGVSAITVSGQTVYAGGRFTSIGGQPRNQLAALDARTGLATNWNPDVQGNPYRTTEVDAIAVSGQTIYAGGGFDSIGGQLQYGIAAFDATSGRTRSWNPDIQAGPGRRPSVSAIAVSGQTVYAGGDFNSIGGQLRNGIAALDPKTGAVTSWDPNPPGAVGQVGPIAVSGQTVYVGGYFTSIGGRTRHAIAALDATTGAATSWNPNIHGIIASYGGSPEVSAIAVSGRTVYAGGYFTSVGATPRNNLAAIDASTGRATSWNPSPRGGFENGPVGNLSVSGRTVYAGGTFDSIGGQPRNRIAAVDATTGLATNWNPDPNGGVSALARSGQNVYVGGDFTSIGGKPRNGIAALDVAKGDATNWDPKPLIVGRRPHPGTIHALAVSDSTVYVSGTFTSIGGRERRRVAALDATTGKPTGWAPHPNAGVWALALGPDGSLWAGGSFSYLAGPGGPSQSGIARFVPKP